jgi:hypothetical protein
MFRIQLILLLVIFSSISVHAKEPTLEELIEWNKAYKERILDIIYESIPIDYAEKLEKWNEVMFEFNFTWNREWIEKNSFNHNGFLNEEPVWQDEIAPLIKNSLLAEYDEETLKVLDVTCKQRKCITWVYVSTDILTSDYRGALKKFPSIFVDKIIIDISRIYNYELGFMTLPGGKDAHFNKENYKLMNIIIGFRPKRYEEQPIQ